MIIPDITAIGFIGATASGLVYNFSSKEATTKFALRSRLILLNGLGQLGTFKGATHPIRIFIVYTNQLVLQSPSFNLPVKSFSD